VFVRPVAQWPAVLAFRLLDGQVIDARDTSRHQTALVKLPIFVTIRAEPIAGIISPFIGEPHRDTGVIKGLKLFDQPVVKFFGPFAAQELHNHLPSREKLSTVSPHAVDRVSQRNSFRFTGVPCVFSHPHLLGGCFSGEGGTAGRTFGSVDILTRLDSLAFA
ncbi:uncharacterized protein METZ01_LOCUS296655, partial [marine metagenome]